MNLLLLLLLRAVVCASVCCSMAARAEVEEAVVRRFLDAPPAALETAVAWYGAGPTRPPPLLLRHHAAVTAWNVEWSLLAARRADGGCVATNVKTRLAVSITLPRPAPPDTPSQPQLDRLQLHEAGHLQIARAAAHHLDAGLLALPPLADCPSLQREAARLAAVQLERLQHVQAAYDVLTEHGRRPHDLQDAAWP